MEKTVIIGGGIAGLTCLNALIDKGISPLLLEGGSIGSPKMCGEFLAPPALSILDQWGIGPIQTINDVKFFSKNKNLLVNFPKKAGAFSRSEAELQLAMRAKKQGGLIRENVSIKKIISNHDSTYTFILSSGETLHANSAFIATGRFNCISASMTFPYFALKTHFKHVIEPATLIMHSDNQTYFGIVPITETKSNFACLVKQKELLKFGSLQNFFYHLIDKHILLQQAFSNYNINELSFLEGKSPEFGFKKNPKWPNIYWIGDALASFPPAIGYGFAHSVSSALLAVSFFLQNNASKYITKSKNMIRTKLVLGKLMHHLLLQSRYNNFILALMKTHESNSRIILKLLGYA